MNLPQHQLELQEEYFRRVGPQCDKNISALARLLNNLEEGFPRDRCLLLIHFWTQIKQYNDAGIDLICILESLNLEMEGASEEFDLAFKPDKAFVKMLEEFKTDTLDLWNLSKLPQKIRADQLRKLAECRDFIRAEYPDLSEKMDVICELCGAPNQ